MPETCRSEGLGAFLRSRTAGAWLMLLVAHLVVMPVHAAPVLELRSVRTIGPEIAPGVRLKGPHGVSVADDGNVLISDDLGHQVHVLNAHYELIRSFGSELDLAYVDAAIQLPDGFLIANTGRNRLLWLDAQGKLVRTVKGWGWFSSNQLSNPRSLSAMPGGEFLVADWGNNKVRRITASGELVATYGAGAVGPGALDGPIDAVHAPNWGIVASDHRGGRLVMFALDGTVRMALGRVEAPLGQAFTRPAGLAMGPHDCLWMVDRARAEVRVITGHSGAFGHASVRTDVALSEPTDLAFNLDRQLLVTDPGQQVVHVFSIHTRLPQGDIGCR